MSGPSLGYTEVVEGVGFTSPRASIGATMGDVLTKSHEKGGLDFGTIGSSLILGAILIILIVFTTIDQTKGAGVAVVKLD